MTYLEVLLIFMQKRILILETELDGHHLEYINHLFLKAKNSPDQYVFYLPDKFNQIKDKHLNWEYNENVEIVTYNYENKNTNLISSTYYKTNILLKAIKRERITHVFFISLMLFLPSLLFIPSKVKVSGIIYSIYLYRWNNSGFLQKCSDVLKYLFLTTMSCIDKIYILNDKNSVRHLNHLYRTNKFLYLVDPFVPIEDKNVNLEIYNIPITNVVYFHFGSLSDRKGTIEILKSLEFVDPEVQKSITLIFAGKVGQNIKNEFYDLYHKYNKYVQIIVLDYFCDFPLIASFCRRSDILLMPYKLVSLSSGVIGYAAQFGTPVLSPKQGLIGKLVNYYRLGYVIDSVNSKSIASFINEYSKNNKYVVSKKYLETNTVSAFIDSLDFA